MDITSFINNNDINELNRQLLSIQDEMTTNSYNIFSVSSYNTYLENFHSDVIAMLLNPSEKHNKKNLYLNLFLDYLNERGALINKDDFAFCEITREKGKIDIWIKDNTSRKSIIIENKINNAPDREKQLENYYTYSNESKFEVVAIVYLTLDGNKNAPKTDNENLNEKIINLSAFANIGQDLCSGWLFKCYDKSEDTHNRSFIFQFIKLIKHLSKKGMDNKIKDDFYAIIKEKEEFDKAKTISILFEGLKIYRANMLINKLDEKWWPFKKPELYGKDNVLIFVWEIDKATIFKLNVEFSCNGDARIDFYTHYPENTQMLSTENKLKSIGLKDEFQSGDIFYGHMFKTFTIEKHENIENIDFQLYAFLIKFFEKLR
jgi:hypothetical protein